jgi:hypothetical protein
MSFYVPRRYSHLTAQIVLRPGKPMAVRLLPRSHPADTLERLFSREYTGDVLHHLTGKGTRRPVFDTDRGVYVLPKVHANAVIRGLATRFAVTVWQYGDPRKACHPSCEAAQSPRFMCECACAGKGHGETKPRLGSSLMEAVARTGLVIVDETFTSEPIPLRRFTIRREAA